jgi:hypothetical protein
MEAGVADLRAGEDDAVVLAPGLDRGLLFLERVEYLAVKELVP